MTHRRKSAAEYTNSERKLASYLRQHPTTAIHTLSLASELGIKNPELVRKRLNKKWRALGSLNRIATERQKHKTAAGAEYWTFFRLVTTT